MIKEEAASRLAPRAQAGMDKFRHSEHEVTLLTEELQADVVRRYGFRGQKFEPIGLQLLRSASSLYPDHPVIKETFYVKFNRCVSGKLKVGDPCPNVPLLTLSGERTSLQDYFTQAASTHCGWTLDSKLPAPPLVMVAGSST